MVQIITDSAADFEAQELEALQLHCIALPILFADGEYSPSSKDAFYEKLAHADTLPKTAQPSPQLLADLFQKSVDSGDNAIYICISSALSGIYQSALAVMSQMNSNHCYVVDSLNATGGQRLIVEYAVKLRDQGLSAGEIVVALEEFRERITLYACMDTLTNLYAGGRISHTAYHVGNIANIKPFLTVDRNGRVSVLGKTIGLRRGMAQLAMQAEKVPYDPEFPFYVMYTDNRENGRLFANCLRTVGIDVPEAHIIQVGAAIGTHIGPNAIGFVYVTK